MREKRKKSNSRLIKFLAVCIAASIMFFAFMASCNLQNVIVEGNTHYSEEELKKKIIMKATDHNAVFLYLRYKYGEKVNIPFVDDVDVELVDKNTVKIHVYEKVVTGCIEYMSGYMYFDKDGIVVESSNEKLDNVPFITGLNFDRIILYSKLEVNNDAIFNIILNLTQLIRKYELNIEKIDFNSNLEVSFYHEDIKILLGKRDTYDEQIAELKNLLPKAKGQKILLDMKNFTEGQERIIATPLN